MSVSAVGGGDSAVIAQLQRQLKQDQRTLTAAEKAKADDKTIQLDEARVQADQVALAVARQVQAAAKAQAEQQKPPEAADPAQQTATDRTQDGSWYL